MLELLASMQEKRLEMALARYYSVTRAEILRLGDMARLHLKKKKLSRFYDARLQLEIHGFETRQRHLAMATES